MRALDVPREELEPLSQVPVLFDALVAEDDTICVFRKTVSYDDPGVSWQRVTPRWPHHLPGELIISLTGQAGMIALRRKHIIPASWRGHGVRIRDARFSAPVLLGETFFTRIEIGRMRRVSGSIFVSFRFRMWKTGADGKDIEVFRSEQDAMFFPGE